MPIRSKAQWRYLFATNPRRAHKWVHETPSGRRQSYKRLPSRKRKR